MENNLLYRRNGYNGGYQNRGLNGYTNLTEQATPTTPKDWCAIRQQAPTILAQAKLDWLDTNGRQISAGKKVQGHYIMLPFLENYWQGVRGTISNPPSYQNINPRNYALGSARGSGEGENWSAAFVCWVMRSIGVVESDGFAFSLRHLNYIVQALSNALKIDTTKPIWLKDVSTPLEVGDILCFNRNGSTYSLSNLARTYLDSNNDRNSKSVTGASHCDVVKGFFSLNNRNYVEVIGGNKRGRTVKTSNQLIEVDANNVLIDPTGIENPGSCFGVIKVGPNCATATPTTPTTRESYGESFSSNQNGISGSVGLNATNNRNDVTIIQNVLKNIGYPIQNSGVISNNQNDSTILSIINFQTNNNLRVTGNILPGDSTLNLLFQRNNTTAYLTEQATPATTPPVKDWCDIRQGIAYMLGQAELDWHEVYDPRYPNGRFIKENELEKDINGRDIQGKYRMAENLEDYWKAVRGTSTNPPSYQNVNPISYAKGSSSNGIAWSAAFVSWVMRQSGVEESDGFAFSARHITYIVQALSNARRNDATKPIWLKDITTPIEKGDILCFNRKNDNGVMSNYTLSGLARTYLDANNNVKNLEKVGGVSHCDVVKEIFLSNGRNYAYAVGGNKGIRGEGDRGWTVNNVEIELDANNVIINPGHCFAVIKVGPSCATATPTTPRESYGESFSSNQNGIRGSVGLNATNNRNDVAIVQNLLKNLGYPVQNNGVILNGQTDATILSIFNFQTNNSLRITGNISPNDATINLLNQRNSNLGNVTESDDESVHQPFFTNAFTFRRHANDANTLNVFFEGDSWLDYPIPNVLDLYDTITNRNQRLNLNSLHLAKFGETTTDMFRDRANFEQYITNYRIDRIYFSGGGNDVFPNLGSIVRRGPTFDASFFTDPSKYYELRSIPRGDELNRRCVQYKNHINTQAFDTAFFNAANLNTIFTVIKDNYLRFGNIINAHSTPNLIFYMHSYDYPMYKLGVRPTLGVSLPIGPWLKPAFDSLGITDPVLINYIIIRLLDKFYCLLHYIQAQFTALGFRFQSRIIDYRGLLNSSEYWRDEIHPNSLGATRLATRVNF